MHTSILDAENCWQAVTLRDKTLDGAFVYAVATTGVYCRPSCASRQPRRENVEFFTLPAAAEQEGYRPCKRCRPQDAAMRDPRAKLAQEAAEHIKLHVDEPERTALAALGAAFGYDPQHVQRVFKDVLGLTPKQYADALKARQFKEALREGSPVLDAGLNAGYGSATRTYENGARALGMTPAAYKRGGEGVALRYTVAETFLGTMLVAATNKGICAVGIYGSENEARDGLRREYPNAAQVERDDDLSDTVRQIVAHIEDGTALDLPLDIQATAFQWRVWRALQAIPRGETRSYAQVAQAIGEPDSARAVAAACASNRAAVVIPCHRVIKSDGGVSGYKWGVPRKQKLLAAEKD
jgi:AraC family transcriptional regulator, regulatory protein of adaptative response / methylated-DNA-[protein]-cysteine methyltransferase